jgi:hypothetical protein
MGMGYRVNPYAVEDRVGEIGGMVQDSAGKA